jgi:hypothetical protein
MANKYEHPGPWDNEPDELWWADEKTGYECHLCRNHSGALCGYVRLPEGHPLHGVGYSDALPESLRPLKDVVMEGDTGRLLALLMLAVALVAFGLSLAGYPVGK